MAEWAWRADATCECPRYQSRLRNSTAARCRRQPAEKNAGGRGFQPRPGLLPGFNGFYRCRRFELRNTETQDRCQLFNLIALRNRETRGTCEGTRSVFFRVFRVFRGLKKRARCISQRSPFVTCRRALHACASGRCGMRGRVPRRSRCRSTRPRASSRRGGDRSTACPRTTRPRSSRAHSARRARR